MIEESFERIFHRAPEATAKAPGRVNLIGEHTDYNDGFVLPAAINRTLEFAARRRADRTLRIYSLDFRDQVEFSLDRIQKDSAHPWSNYLRGVALMLEGAGHRLPGAEIVFGGNVPREAGLSSSAAVEVGAIVLWRQLAAFDLPSVEAVRLARKAENEFVGVPSGVMDQFVVALARRDHALFLDCRDLSYRQIPLGGNVRIIVCNTGVKRALAQSEYRVRLDQCRAAIERLSSEVKPIELLRDLSARDLPAAERVLDPLLFRRVRHVVMENQRVLDAVELLEGGDLESFGRLMNESHASLRDDYEVSSRELDALAELAWKQPGVLGARMTGAGFGGCTVNLVQAEAAKAFVEAVREGYARRLGLEAECYVCESADGALTAA